MLKKLKKVLLICLIAIIAGGVVGVATRSNKIITPNEYLQLDQIDELSKIGDQENLWLNQRCFDYYQSNVYGNNNEILESNGKVYKNKNVFAFSDDTGLHINDDVVIQNSVSFLNYYKNQIYYRDDKDRSIYCYDLKTKRIKAVLSGNYTQLKIINDKLYYVDYKNNKLYSYSLKDKKCIKELDMKLQKYTVIGNKLLVLTTNKQLKLINGENVEFSIPGINNYVYNGNLITLSKDGIYSWKDMNSPNKIKVGNFNRIIGLDRNNLYLDNYRNKKLNILSINLQDKECSVLRTFNKEIIINSYLKITDIEYLEYSKINEDSNQYYVINDFDDLVKDSEENE